MKLALFNLLLVLVLINLSLTIVNYSAENYMASVFTSVSVGFCMATSLGIYLDKD